MGTSAPKSQTNKNGSKEQELIKLLSEKEKEIKKLEKEIESNKTNLKEREKKINEKENNILLVENKLKEKEVNIKLVENNLKEKEKNIKLVENELREKENNIKIEQNKLKKKESNIILEQNKLKEKEKNIILEQNKLKEKENNIILEQNKLKEKEKNIILEQNKLKEKENNIILEQNKLKEKENNIILEENISKEKENEFNLNVDVMKQLENLKKEYEEIKNKYLNLKKGVILVGLNNIGATCYMNATLQCFSNTDKLTDFFLNKYYEPNNYKKIMSNAYYNVIKDLWNSENHNKSISPDEFKEKLSQENPLFAGIAANDSKDLINFLMERFHNELNVINNDNDILNNYYNNSISQNENQLNEQKMLNIFKNEFKTKYNSIISNLFYGILETRSQCQICRNIKYNFQVYSFIEFPLEKVNQYCFNTGKRINYNMNNNKNPDVNLYECFEYYGNIELMTQDNQMYCNICNCTYDSLYGCSLYSTPEYLIINLNRGRGAVYECNVIFPEQLNLFNFVSCKNGNTVYELYAVICHIGPSSMSGHFVAYCRNRIDKKWYLYNDGSVNLCQNPNEYRKGMVYILFYQVLKSIINNFL